MSKSAPEAVDRRRPSADQGAAQLRGRAAANAASQRALCIGIDSYLAAPLVAGVDDCRRWSAALASFGFEIEVLEDRKATRRRIEQAISRMLRTTVAGGDAVIQFSGHATQLPIGRSQAGLEFVPALVPFDYVSAGCLSHAALAELLMPHAERVNITLFFDCSHPGSVACGGPAEAPEAAVAGSSPLDNPGRERRRYLSMVAGHVAQPIRSKPSLHGLRGVPIPTSVARLAAAPWVHVAAACEDEFAYESAAGGEFSLAALAHLQRAMKEGWTPARFLDAVSGALASRGRQTPRVLPITGLRNGLALLGEAGCNLRLGTSSINTLSLRELIRAVDALNVDAARLRHDLD